MKDKYFAELIKDSYGDPGGLANFLDKAIEMLFYIEDHTFDRRDVQSVVSALRTIISILRRQE
ncbi:hypothetical protein LV716_14500 [Flagellimonas sp. HMM57]|uniref:hypothetical protein n=1 Tax=unclassified Flagellimonas TaxID=2644544 RepID=UPI0013D347AE|nr:MULTISPECIES: hypothetical protein [unclassified Flagellimonas]UII75458.1 hypothetical protein LV716_14500 [Flagellimonas sp. HMM57]